MRQWMYDLTNKGHNVNISQSAHPDSTIKPLIPIRSLYLTLTQPHTQNMPIILELKKIRAVNFHFIITKLTSFAFANSAPLLFKPLLLTPKITYYYRLNSLAYRVKTEQQHHIPIFLKASWRRLVRSKCTSLNISNRKLRCLAV